MIINTGLTIAVFLALLIGVAVATWPDVPWTPLLIVTIVVNLFVPIVFYPWSKTLFVALDLSVRPYSGEEVAAAHRATGVDGDSA